MSEQRVLRTQSHELQIVSKLVLYVKKLPKVLQKQCTHYCFCTSGIRYFYLVIRPIMEKTRLPWSEGRLQVFEILAGLYSFFGILAGLLSFAPLGNR